MYQKSFPEKYIEDKLKKAFLHFLLPNLSHIWWFFKVCTIRKCNSLWRTESRSHTRISTKTATISFVKSKRIVNDFIIYFLQAFEIASKVWLSAWASSREESKVGVSTSSLCRKKKPLCTNYGSLKNFYTQGNGQHCAYSSEIRGLCLMICSTVPSVKCFKICHISGIRKSK